VETSGSLHLDPAGVDPTTTAARYGRRETNEGWTGDPQRARPDIATAASEEQRVTDKDQNSGLDQTSDELTVETTSVFRADFLNELDAPSTAGSEGAVSGVEGLPVGSALLVVKRGPNAGSRFLLDQPTTSAGRHPDSDIFLDDVTVSRRHAEFRLENAEFQVVDVGSLNGTYVNREPVDSAVLANGDEVQIGKFRLVFLTGPKTDDSSPDS
jgi:pSer/pThr/pTyr-binding forkhead associated (FHA) protein